jgi:hypothetical protein
MMMKSKTNNINNNNNNNNNSFSINKIPSRIKFILLIMVFVMMSIGFFIDNIFKTSQIIYYYGNGNGNYDNDNYDNPIRSIRQHCPNLPGCDGTETTCQCCKDGCGSAVVAPDDIDNICGYPTNDDDDSDEYQKPQPGKPGGCTYCKIKNGLEGPDGGQCFFKKPKGKICLTFSTTTTTTTTTSTAAAESKNDNYQCQSNTCQTDDKGIVVLAFCS